MATSIKHNAGRLAAGLGAIFTVGLLALDVTAAAAAPPAWAPANGYRSRVDARDADRRYDLDGAMRSTRYRDQRGVGLDPRAGEGRYYRDGIGRNGYDIRDDRFSGSSTLDRNGDLDRDGIPNFRDEDVDGDGIPNWRDDNLNNRRLDRNSRGSYRSGTVRDRLDGWYGDRDGRSSRTRRSDLDRDGRRDWEDRDLDGDGIANNRAPRDGRRR